MTFYLLTPSDLIKKIYNESNNDILAPDISEKSISDLSVSPEWGEEGGGEAGEDGNVILQNDLMSPGNEKIKANPIPSNISDTNSEEDFSDKVHINDNDTSFLNHSKSENNGCNILTKLRLKNANRIIMAHININSIRNKFEMLREIVKTNIDILLISETKINSSFPTSQFEIEGFSTPYRKDRSKNGQNGGGILLYIRDHIASKKLNPQPLEDLECLCVEIKIYKKSWLIFGTYNPNKNLISNHTSMLGKSIDLLTH